MSISRVNPDWAFGSKLTSAELDAIEDNITYALDKRAGETDTLESDVTATGLVVFKGQTVIHEDGELYVNAASDFNAPVNLFDAVLIDDSATVTGMVKTSSGGRIELGDNDYPQLASGHAGRTVVRRIPPSCVLAQAASLSANGSPLDTDLSVPDTGSHLVRNLGFARFASVDTGNGSQSRAIYYDLTPYLIDGATLTEVAVTITGASGHAAMPALKPRIRVSRNNFTGVDVVLHSAGSVISDAVSTTSSYQGPHGIVATCDQNNAIDKSASLFYLTILNEGGTNSLSGLLVREVTITQTIVDLRPG